MVFRKRKVCRDQFRNVGCGNDCGVHDRLLCRKVRVGDTAHMALISVTRLRLRSRLYLPAFIFYSVRSSRQAQNSPGNLGVRLLKDRNQTYWTCTAWSDETAMKNFMRESPHAEAMRKLPKWCNEASLVHWTQSEPTFPSWQEAYRRLKQEGRKSKVLYPSKDHERLDFPEPTGN